MEILEQLAITGKKKLRVLQIYFKISNTKLLIANNINILKTYKISN